MPEPAVAEQVLWDDLRAVLDEELSQLPQKYRTVVVLCDLEDRTRREAALQLGIPEGTVAGWIARARVMLAQRLTKRGVTLSGGALALVLSQNVASAGVSGTVMTSTIKVATQFAAGKTVASGGLSLEVPTLTEGVLKAMMMSKLKMVVSVVLMVGLLTMGATALWPTTYAQEEKPREVAKTKAEQNRIQGTWSLVSIETVHGTSPETLRTTKLEPKGFTITFKGDQVTHQQTNKDGTVQRKTFRITLDTKRQPHRLTLHATNHSIRYICEVKGDSLRLCCFSLAEQDGVKLKTWPKEFSTKVTREMFPRLELLKRVKDNENRKKPKQAKKKEAVIAWGKEIGGLQAGLGFPPGQKRAYRHGETVRLVVRARNVGKKDVKFSYLYPFCEHPPTVTDREGKEVPQPDVIKEIGSRSPVNVTLAPGKEIVLHELKHQIRPASESGSRKFRQPYALYGAGKVAVQYQQVLGRPSMGFPGWKLDPTLSKLATGKLELEIKSAPPVATAKKKALTPEEAIRRASDSKLRQEFNATKPPVQFKVQFVTKSILVKARCPFHKSAASNLANGDVPCQDVLKTICGIFFTRNVPWQTPVRR